MLVFNRKIGQSVHVGDIVITVDKIVFETILLNIKTPTVTIDAGLTPRAYVQIGDVFISHNSIIGQSKVRINLACPKDHKVIRGEKLQKEEPCTKS